MTFKPGDRVHLRTSAPRVGMVAAVRMGYVLVCWEGRDDLIPYDAEHLARVKNTLVTIGCTGNRIAYLNLSVEEATRRFLARENEHVYGDDEKKTQLDSCDRVSIMEFDDEFPTYD